jgi:predicted aldo/keto reductase-like oxidoreductase
MVLSGMSNEAQMQDNVRTFGEEKPLSPAENQLLLDIAEGMKNVIPCTGCRYCCDGCPMELDIPTMMSICSDIRFAPVVNSVMMLQTGPEDKRPSACIACGNCTRVCPQGIDIPAVMQELTQRMESIPQWADICAQREALQRKG